jgi:hypothetical protein
MQTNDPQLSSAPVESAGPSLWDIIKTAFVGLVGVGVAIVLVAVMYKMGSEARQFDQDAITQSVQIQSIDVKEHRGRRGRKSYTYVADVRNEQGQWYKVDVDSDNTPGQTIRIAYSPTLDEAITAPGTIDRGDFFTNRLTGWPFLLALGGCIAAAGYGLYHFYLLFSHFKNR